jgi:hypothetical protein
MAVRREHVALAVFRGLTLVVAVSMSLAICGRCSAQTLNLSPDTAVFENGGPLTITGSTINGTVDVSVNSPFPSIYNSTINGGLNSPLNVDPTSPDVSLVNSIVNGTKAPGVSPAMTNLPMPTESIATTDYDGGIDLHPGDSMSFSGASGVNIFNIKGDFNAQNSTISLVNLPGVTNATYIFNVYTDDESGLAFSGVTMNLGAGVRSSDVIFNVLNGGGLADIANYSTVYGTFYTNSGEVNVANSVVNGALVAGGGNNVSILNSTITDPSFTAAAPEMPTIMTAGIGMFLLAATSSYRNRVRRKHSANPGQVAACGQWRY